jgi:hypothetical protein
MRMRITAPCTVNSEPKNVGEIADVTEPGEVARLTHYGQAVPVDDVPQPPSFAPGRPATDEQEHDNS